MNFWPVLGRELRVNARSNRLYWGRFTAALLAIGLVAWIWMTMGSYGNSAQRAQQIFGALSTLAFIYCLALGGFVTADSISEEKRDGTLGLLFLTNLRSHDVVLGKTAAASLRAFYTVIAIFPVLTIPILLGGLSGGMIARMTLVLANTLFFTLCVGLFVSAISRHDRKAQAGALCTIIAFVAVIPAVLALLKFELKWKINDSWFGISPAGSFSTAFDLTYAKDPKLFWTMVLIPHAMGWFFFGGAAFIVRRIWQDRPSGAALGRWASFKNWLRGSAARRRNYRAKLLGINPYYWLAARDRRKPAYVGMFLAVCAACWVLLYAHNPRDMLDQEAFLLCAIFLHTILKFWVAAEAGRQLYDDRRNSGLELTLSTPLQVREILEGQFLALLRQFGWAFGLVIAFDIVGMIMGARARQFGAETEWVLAWVAHIFVLLADAGAIAVAGMWLSLTCRRSSRAVAQTLGYVLFVPWLVLFAMFTYMAMVRFSNLDSLKMFIGAYFVVSLVTDMVLFVWASGNLTSRFREVAVQRFERSAGS